METDKYERLVPDVQLFVDRRCFPDWEIVKQRIRFHDLTFIVGGKSNYFVNGEKFTVEAGDIIYIPSGSIREAHTFKDQPMHSFAFNFTWLEPSDDTPLPFQTVTKNRMTTEIMDYIKEFAHVWMSKPPFYRMQARGLFQLIVHRLLANSYRRQTAHQDPRVNKVIKHIVDRYPEDLTIGELAKLVHLHPVYLGKLFKQQTGTSCKAYINRIRVNNAEMMLSAGGFTVSEVAERCGFQDVAYFSNVFKSVKGYPPSIAAKLRETDG
ncbi:helix-turn-helix domain-containing protein [Paenibacillus thailandensis]|uniref:Helix-turn-helix domain-containing protein n=1 Tax=Paenibacillus thailandensis TaxID=393250 RepID=A0ABW5R011_9BACL